MKISPIVDLDLNGGANSPQNRHGPRWYAAYISANHEKRVQGQLEQRCVESFLTVYESMRHWKDRRIHLQLPLFSGYVFFATGPLEDGEGILIRRKGNLQVAISIQLILKSIAVDVELADVQPLSFHADLQSQAKA